MFNSMYMNLNVNENAVYWEYSCPAHPIKIGEMKKSLV